MDFVGLYTNCLDRVWHTNWHAAYDFKFCKDKKKPCGARLFGFSYQLKASLLGSKF